MPNEQNDILTDKLSGWRGEKGRNVYKKLKAVSRQPLTNFVNLKSNTMKNTLQRYGLLINLQIIQLKKYVL